MEQDFYPLIITPNSKETIDGQEQQEQIKEFMQFSMESHVYSMFPISIILKMERLIEIDCILNLRVSSKELQLLIYALRGLLVDSRYGIW